MTEFSGILQQYGKPAAVHRGKETQIGSAMVQPLLDESSQWTPTPLGRKRQDRFLYLGAPELELDAANGFVEWDGQAYDIVTAHPMALGEKVLYWRAVLTLREDEADL